MTPMKILALIAVSITGALLLYATGDLPKWGDPLSPANASELSRHYILETRYETKVPNVVTAVLADYRGYDTMFETVVVFVAGIGILAVLKGSSPRHILEERPLTPGDDDLITVMTCRIIAPVIQLFSLYVIAHGHHSPGGGFQGGVMFGASFILIALTCGLPAALQRLSLNKAILLAVVGVGIYSGTGLLCMAMGQNFLDYGILHHFMPATDSVMARSHSMLIVEIGVAFTVTTIMFVIYMALCSRGTMKGGL